MPTMQIFTTDDLLQFLYKETPAAKTAAIQSELNSNWPLSEKMNVIEAAKKVLSKITLFSPRKKAVDNILAYATNKITSLSTTV